MLHLDVDVRVLATMPASQTSVWSSNLQANVPPPMATTLHAMMALTQRLNAGFMVVLPRCSRCPAPCLGDALLRGTMCHSCIGGGVHGGHKCLTTRVFDDLGASGPQYDGNWTSQDGTCQTFSTEAFLLDALRAQAMLQRHFLDETLHAGHLEKHVLWPWFRQLSAESWSWHEMQPGEGH